MTWENEPLRSEVDLSVSRTPYGSYRIWAKNDWVSKHSDEATFIRQICLWGGADKYTKNCVSYEIARKDIDRLWRKLLGLGTVELISHDPSSPVVLLHSDT